MNLARQREILCDIIGYSDTMAYSDYSDACDTLDGPTVCDFGQIDYVLDMDMPADQRAALCATYAARLEHYADTEFSTTWDFFGAVTGSDDLNVAGAVPVLPAGSVASSYAYMSADTYAEKYGVAVADILIVPAD